MANLSTPNLARIRQLYPEIAEALAAHERAVNNMGEQTNSAPVGQIPPPLPHSALSVIGGGGIVDVAITKDTPIYRGEENFFDYSNDSGKTWHTKAIGPAKNWRGSLGAGPFVVRSYASHSASGSSEPLYAPAVSTTGAEPPMQTGQGSGTGTMGYGDVPYNTTLPPKRA